MIVGLRIDVCTFRGTKLGVPALLRLLDERGILATFFFSVGPDNMGRHLWRLWRPRFLVKMLRTRAAGLYGWDILLRGTLWPGPTIGHRLPNHFRSASFDGHEVGLHAWDHHAWQTRVDAMSAADIRTTTARGLETLAQITGVTPSCSAVPGWRCNDLVLLEQESFPLRYQSDCRGRSVFLPQVGTAVVNRPQIPVTLPTYDELIGQDGLTEEDYNERVLGLLDPTGLNVLAVHAEVEGISKLALFADFVDRAAAAGVRFLPLGKLIPPPGELAVAPVEQRRIPGRDGLVACQGDG